MRIEQDVALAPYTSLRLGGPARYLARCATLEDLREALEWARSRTLAVHVLGGGSNTIFADAGFDGLVVQVALRGVEFEVQQGDMTRATAAAGEDWDAFVARTVEGSLSGVECLSGIPGLVGATPIQNVGAYGQEVADCIVGVRALARDTLEQVVFTPADCAFAYRTSRFKAQDRDRFIITSVTYQLAANRLPQIRYAELAKRLQADGVDLSSLAPGRAACLAVRNAVLAVRRGKSMVIDSTDPDARSAGSFYLNPVLTDAQLAQVQAAWRQRGGTDADIPVFAAGPGLHKVAAAWLVEHAGFSRGTRRGGAGISSKHALALVSYGDSTADLLALAEEVATGVRQTFGVELEREPVVVP